MPLLTHSAAECRDRAIKALAELPPFSPVLDRLMATLSSDGASIAHVSDIVETDTVIAGNILKLVNSALYGRSGTVNSVRRAVSLLGINKLRNTVFAMSMNRVWGKVCTAPGWSTAAFNLHSVACGLMCDFLVQRRPAAYAEGAFAAGLFHDLGQLLIAVALKAEYAEIENLHASGFGSIEECEIEVLGVSHSDLSADALALWNLPSEIQDAVRHHHTGAGQAPKGSGYGLALIVHCADEYTSNCGMQLLGGPKQAHPERARQALAALDIEIESASFLEDYRTEFEALAGVIH